MPFICNIVLYDKEPTWGGSLKKERPCHIPLETQLSIVTILYANVLIFSIAKIWLPLKHETDTQTIISAILGLQGLKLSRPEYSFRNCVAHGNVLICLACLCKTYM